jgi:serine/threonine protein phosphatase PrpC
MRFSLHHFCLQKLGNEEADYEDAFAPKIEGIIDQETFAIAIADGATESSFASEWARMLTRAFVKERFTNIQALQVRTEILSKRWHTFVNRRPLPWFAEEKVRLGAFTTLLGVELASNSNGSDESGSWSAIAVGDSCLFQVRNGDLVISFPISSAGEFGSSPTLLSTNLACNSQLWEKVMLQTAEWHSGDILLLATDALARWFLTEYENNEKPWDILFGFTEDPSPRESFQAWANDARRSNRLANDDITLIIVRL